MLTTTALLLLAASGHAFDAVSQRRIMHSQLGKEVLAAPAAPALPVKVAAFAAIPGDDHEDGNEDGDSNNGDAEQGKDGTVKDDTSGANVTQSRFGPFCFKQKVSHFDDSEQGTFCQRYWVDSQYYKEGGPVFILDGGETDGAGR